VRSSRSRLRPSTSSMASRSWARSRTIPRGIPSCSFANASFRHDRPIRNQHADHVRVALPRGVSEPSASSSARVPRPSAGHFAPDRAWPRPARRGLLVTRTAPPMSRVPRSSITGTLPPGSQPLLPLAHRESDGVRAPSCRYLTPAYVVPMHRAHSVEPRGASAVRPLRASDAETRRRSLASGKEERAAGAGDDRRSARVAWMEG
jgi:hypothetical protein